MGYENKRNTIKTQDGIELYINNFWFYVDDYIQSLNNPDDIKNRLCFSGCLRHIYKNMFKPNFNDYVLNNRSSNIDYSDIQELYFVYDLFLELCNKYKMEYTENGFCTMSGISKDTLNEWIDNKSIPQHDSKYPSSLWCNFSKKIKYNSEQGLSESMLNGNLMAYATLKCWYGWKEETNINVNQIQSNKIQSIETIAQQHNIAIPEKPNLE